eukprot:7340087-Alexandrium_andersonii.AAC.1
MQLVTLWTRYQPQIARKSTMRPQPAGPPGPAPPSTSNWTPSTSRCPTARPARLGNRGPAR